VTVANLEKTMASIANAHDGDVIPASRLEQARKERQRRISIATSTIVASGLTEQRDVETAEA
jgi:hypothetical protein